MHKCIYILEYCLERIDMPSEARLENFFSKQVDNMYIFTDHRESKKPFPVHNKWCFPSSQ